MRDRDVVLSHYPEAEAVEDLLPLRQFAPIYRCCWSSTTALIWTLACWLVALRRTRRGLTPPVGCLMLGEG